MTKIDERKPRGQSMVATHVPGDGTGRHKRWFQDVWGYVEGVWGRQQEKMPTKEFQPPVNQQPSAILLSDFLLSYMWEVLSTGQNNFWVKFIFLTVRTQALQRLINAWKCLISGIVMAYYTNLWLPQRMETGQMSVLTSHGRTLCGKDNPVSIQHVSHQLSSCWEDWPTCFPCHALLVLNDAARSLTSTTLAAHISTKEQSIYKRFSQRAALHCGLHLVVKMKKLQRHLNPDLLLHVLKQGTTTSVLQGV